MAVRLLLTASVEEQWRGVVEPWLATQKPWLDPRPTIVLTPSRAHGFYLRSRLIGQGKPALGFRFWTPSDARKFLLGQLESHVRSVTQTDLRLLARLTAERLLREEATHERASLASVVQDPGPFLRAYDLLLGAGWDPARDGADYGRLLSFELTRDLQRSGIASQAGIHRLLRTAPRRGSPSIAGVLMLGFNAVHWPLWDLLQAVYLSAENTLIALDQPGKFGGSADELWIGSWENLKGIGYEFPDSPSIAQESLASLAESYEDGAYREAPGANIHFIATADLSTQVTAIALQVIEYLKEPDYTRLGIVFPEANALALGVADQLRQMDLPLDDGPGFFQYGIFESRPWRAWLDLQEEATVRSAIHWLRACEAEKVSCGLTTLSASRSADLLDWALGQSLIDDLDFLTLQAEEEGGESKMLADFLRKRVALPAESTFQGYLTATREALRRLGWKAHLELLPEEAPSWLEQAPAISRATFLAWLRETADSRERVRPAGNHFYGKIHLLLYGQLAGQSWSHLILTGQNEGVWPRLFESGAFGSRYELSALNAKARTLNERGVTQGRQGAGHETVVTGHGHCLVPLERYDLSLRDLSSALRATQRAVCLTAVTLGDGRNLLPSDFFNHAWQTKTGQVLDETMFRRLAQLSAARCQQHAHLFVAGNDSADPHLIHDVTATRRAYDARRDPLRAFGPYEFSYATPPASPIQLPCKKWEAALAHPASVWLGEIVGVQPWPEGELKWPLAIGTWVHRWLAAALRDFKDGGFLPRLREEADRELFRMRQRAAAAGIDLNPWWVHVWGQARAIALGIGRTLGDELTWKQVLSEVSLPHDLVVALPGCDQGDFALQGKLDLLLVEPASAKIDARQLHLTGCACWVIDFKTGSAKKMNAKAVGEGNAMQVVLYGLSIEALGAASTAMSLHTFDAPLQRQITTGDLLPITGVFRCLDTIHRRGIFGQAPSEDNEFVFRPDFPLTTRPIPTEILAAKWALVHEAPAPRSEDGA